MIGITEWDILISILPVWGFKVLFALWWGCKAILMGLGILCMVGYLKRVGND